MLQLIVHAGVVTITPVSVINYVNIYIHGLEAKRQASGPQFVFGKPPNLMILWAFFNRALTISK